MDTREAIQFLNMAKNLRDDDTFYLWITKLYRFNKPLTLRYMKKEGSRFNAQNKSFYNAFLKSNNKARFAI